MSNVRNPLILALVAAALGSCDGGKKSRFDERAPPASKPASGDGAWAARCAAAITELDELAAHDRPAALLRACPVCEVEAIATRPFDGNPSWLDQLDAAITSCGGYCKPTARKDFLQYIKHDLDSGSVSARAWRKLGEACPAELDVRLQTRAYVGATWFALARVARGMAERLPDAARSGLWAQATFPLPALAPEGSGLELAPVPPGTAVVPPGRFAITVLAEELMVARLPWATLAAGRIEIDGFYPGEPATDLTALNADVTEQNPAALFAPRGLPAAHVVHALSSLDRPARLAVATAPLLVDYAPPMVLPVLLNVRSAADATVVRLTPPLDALVLPAGPLILPVEPTTTVEELVSVLVRAGARTVTLTLASKRPPDPSP